MPGSGGGMVGDQRMGYGHPSLQQQYYHGGVGNAMDNGGGIGMMYGGSCESVVGLNYGGGYGGGAEAGRQGQTWRQRPCIQVGVFLRSQSLVFMRPAMMFCSRRVSYGTNVGSAELESLEWWSVVAVVASPLEW